MKTLAWKKGLIGLCLLAVFAILLLFPRLLPVTSWIDQFTHIIKNSGGAGYLYFAIVYILGTILFFPGALLTLAAGVAFGFVQGTAISLISATIGASCSFLLGRFFFRNAIEKRVRSNPRFVDFDESIAKDGPLIILLLRLSPLIPFNFSNYFFGITKIGYWTFAILSFIGMLPGTMLYVYLGHLGSTALKGERNRTPLEYGFLVLGLIATLGLSWTLARIARRVLQAKNTELSH
ncbi:MAG: ydjZ 1 [Verrucomicrobiales bacterium]|nr:ydjZ 1 [Verrucomicrobiales bacterium]